ncbi:MULTISPECIES: hypothetical protein [unclassified Streptomyces]|uniref:hypothetical protein n=1 Tax=unclassified Streptomyces TaxID=2593676 RepID=UPI002E0D74AA|nr:hypothetical protein OG452_05805 [Streptomyces sp. NBC_01197]WSS52424.1 hypothetical protein OG708_29605 [Streptomyces sp. NBC_01180]
MQHYFSTREEMLVFAMDFASERTSLRVAEGVRELGDPPHPRDLLRVMLTEMLPLHPDARATSRMSAVYVLEALHDASIHTHARATGWRTAATSSGRSSARQSPMATSAPTATRRPRPTCSWHSPA